MQKIKQDNNIFEITENEVETCLLEFMSNNNIENMNFETQSKWNAFLLYARKILFPDKSALKLHKPLDGYQNDNINLNNTNCNAYDTDIIDKICNIYIYMCYMYNKEISILGFSKLTGIDDETINNWRLGKNSNPACLGIYKKITAEREESLTSKLLSNKNPVAIISILNKFYGWNLPGVSKEQAKNNTLSVEDLQRAIKQLPISSTVGEQKQ